MKSNLNISIFCVAIGSLTVGYSHFGLEKSEMILLIEVGGVEVREKDCCQFSREIYHVTKCCEFQN